MSINIKELLNKKHITGDELGKVLLLDDIYRINEKIAFVTDREIDILSHRLKNRRESQNFECYRTFLHWIHNNHHIANSNRYFVLSEYGKLLTFLSNTYYAEQLIIAKNMNNKLNNIIQNLSVFELYNKTYETGDIINIAIKKLKQGSYNVVAFNYAVTLFSEILCLPNLKDAFCVPTNKIEKCFEHLSIIRDNIKLILTGTKEERKQKKKLLNILFPTFSLADFKPLDKYILLARNNVSSSLEQHIPNNIIKILKTNLSDGL